MRCPKCGGKDTKVIETKPSQWGRVRKRQCRKCRHEFSTTEKVSD